MARSSDWLRRGIEGACDRPLPLVELGGAISSCLRPLVPHDGYCLFGFDPITGMTSRHTSHGGYADVLTDCGRLWQNEELEEDLHCFGDLARAALPVGLLGTNDPAERWSARRHEIMPAAGFGAEMRVALVTGGILWGALVFVRERGRRPFERAEAESIAQLVPTLARAVRRLPVVEPLNAVGMAPGVVVLTAEGAVEAMSPEARTWMARLCGLPEDGELPIPAVVWNVAHATRRAARDPAIWDSTSRALAVTGEWLLIHATLLDGHSHGRVAVVLQPARVPLLRPALIAWFGLSGRERDVVELVLDGLASKQIADRLELSPHTVNDHLKAIFRKVGVSGRQELVAVLRG